jgi:hypothetical protein
MVSVNVVFSCSRPLVYPQLNAFVIIEKDNVFHMLLDLLVEIWVIHCHFPPIKEVHALLVLTESEVSSYNCVNCKWLDIEESLFFLLVLVLSTLHYFPLNLFVKVVLEDVEPILVGTHHLPLLGLHLYHDLDEPFDLLNVFTHALRLPHEVENNMFRFFALATHLHPGIEGYLQLSSSLFSENSGGSNLFKVVHQCFKDS